MIPTDRKYSKDHEWVKVEGDLAYVGITDFAQHELGDIVFCELPGIGAKYAAGDSFAVVESVKAASDIYTPVAGTIKKVNEALIDNPEKINQAAYDEFLAVFRIESVDQCALMDAAEYQSLIGG